jgi:hypothetical protein
VQQSGSQSVKIMDNPNWHSALWKRKKKDERERDLV